MELARYGVTGLCAVCQSEQMTSQLSRFLAYLKPQSRTDNQPTMTQQSPKQRFETALKVLSNPSLRLKARRIWKTEMQGCSVFWDNAEKQIELIGNNHEIIIRQHSLDQMWSGYAAIQPVSPTTDQPTNH
jgi:hypothetical protein